MENLDKIKVREQTNIQELKAIAFYNAISQEYEKCFQDVVLSLKEEGRTHLTVADIRRMNEVGIPSVQIAVENIPLDYFENGFYTWLNKTYKGRY